MRSRSLQASRLLHWAVLVLVSAWTSVACAHEGHDHDRPAPLNLPVAPRVVAVTPDYELVGVVSGRERLIIFLHRFATNEPVKDVKLSVSVGEQEFAASPIGDGIFEASGPLPAEGGP